jgi:hypothetical protein
MTVLRFVLVFYFSTFLASPPPIGSHIFQCNFMGMFSDSLFDIQMASSHHRSLQMESKRKRKRREKGRTSLSGAQRQSLS